jgi:exodeoxyribonuclease V alpha subunit
MGISVPKSTKPTTPSMLQTEIEGIVERFTYQNEENGYTIARLIPTHQSSEITIVGNLMGVNVGQSLKITGMWVKHPQYGQQFEIQSYTYNYPATIEGLRKYLGSGLIKGIGPVAASQIVDTFGLETLEIIETNPDRLTDVPGIGPKKAAIINTAWQDQIQIKEMMIFLQGHGISTSLAVKIYKHYGDTAIEIVRSNPYRLAREVFGIGFTTADKIARQIGIPLNDPLRIQAGIIFCLSQLADEGHCFAVNDYLLYETSELLETNRLEVSQQLDHLVQFEDIIIEDEAIYLAPFYHAERGTTRKLLHLSQTQPDRLSNFKSAYDESLFANLGFSASISLTDQQKFAIHTALTNKISILTGGPGTGKSTITGSLVQILQYHRKSILLAAPTGRAAKRLSQATEIEAKTIHRLLEFSPSAQKGFVRDQENPLDADMIIIDEMSMVDILLMNHLLSAIDNGSHLLLVGDVDQLPSVGPGNVLRDLIESEIFPVTRLTEIFRQAQDSHIITNAHRINHGLVPNFPKETKDFFLFVENDPEKAADWVVEIVSQRIPQKFGLNSQQDIQVLTPIHRGAAGVSELNNRLQEALNPAHPKKSEVRQGYRVLRTGDRIMQIQNNYDRQVFNGDMGIISSISIEDQVIQVLFDGRRVDYDFSDINELLHAYAISIHKSQGSEFPAVVVPILTHHYMMLQRNLLYTALTRAKAMVVLVGSRQAIAMAVKNNRIVKRNSRLKTCLQAL